MIPITKVKEIMSTFEREMKNVRFRKAFNKSYKEFLLSESLISIMEKDEMAAKNLIEDNEINPTNHGV